MSKKEEFANLLVKYREMFGDDCDYTDWANWGFTEEDLVKLIEDLKVCLKAKIPAFGTLLPDIDY